MKLESLLALFVTLLSTSKSTRCFKCYSGKYLQDLYPDFPDSNCTLSNGQFNLNVTNCKYGCVKLIIEDNGHKSTVHDCLDKEINKKLITTATIKHNFACSTNLCNKESEWNISNSRNSSNVSEFWIYIVLIIIVSGIIHLIKYICVHTCNDNLNSESKVTSVNSRTRLINVSV